MLEESQLDLLSPPGRGVGPGEAAGMPAEESPAGRQEEGKLRQRLIVALDFSELAEARKLIAELGTEIAIYKIGLEMLYCDGGMEFACELAEMHNKAIFLDAKLYDIPNTVERATRNLLTRCPASFLTVYGAPPMIEAARKGCDSAGRTGKTKIIAVPFLTSDKIEVWEGASLGEVFSAGADGLVCAAAIAKKIRAQLPANRVVVTPGIRMEDSETDDHKSASTPLEALRAGADFLVIGRPVARAQSPQKALQDILVSLSSLSILSSSKEASSLSRGATV